MKSHYDAMFNGVKKPVDWHLSFNTVVTVIILITLVLIIIIPVNIGGAVDKWGEALKVEQKARQSVERTVYNISADLTPIETIIIPLKERE